LTNDTSNQAGTPASFIERLDEAVNLHRAGITGDANAVEEANRLLEQLRLDYPGRPLADAYHGSAMILTARDKTKVMEKLKWARRGLKLLDDAAAADSQDTMIRLLRGKAAYNLPEKYFHRTETAIEDFGFLIERDVESSGLLEREEYLELIYELGDANYRIGRNQAAAMSWSRLAQAAGEHPRFLNLARQKLQTVEGKPDKSVDPSDSVSLLALAIGVVARGTGSALIAWSQPVEKKQKKRHKKKKIS